MVHLLIKRVCLKRIYAKQIYLVQEPLQRKVVQYTPYADSTDYINGHGTHVCGTLAGNAWKDGAEVIGIGGGVAWGAKLAFMDIGLGGKFVI